MSDVIKKKGEFANGKVKRNPTFEDIEKAREAGIKSGQARREKRLMKDALLMILDKSIKKGSVVSTEEISHLAEAKKLNISVQDAIVISMVNEAISGNVKAAEFVRDLIGEKPKDSVELSGELKSSEKLDSILKQLES